MLSVSVVVRFRCRPYDGIYELTGVKYGVLSSELDNPALGYSDYTTFTRKTDFVYDKVLNRKTVTDEVLPNPPVTTLYNHVGGVFMHSRNYF